jgi:Ca-activated chloride channel family protein
MKSGETWYEILEISNDANAEEIRFAYFEKARQYHPDTNPGEMAREWFFQIQEAYETLSDPEKRKLYDESIKGRKKQKELAGLTVVYGAKEILRLKESQIVYAMLELKCLVDFERSKLPQGHLCLVIDCSTSMKGSRIEMVKENIVRLMNALKPTDLISIITFNDKADLLLTPTRVDQISQITEKLSKISCLGGTEIYKGLKAGFDLLWGSSSSGTIRQMILLTDGHTYGDEEACFELAQKLVSRGISLSTLGIGHEWNDLFLDHLATITGGNCTFISNSNDLEEYIREMGESISIVAAEGLSMDFQSEQGITLNSLYRLQPSIAELPLERPIPLGELYYNKKSTYLLTFTLQPVIEGQKSILLAKGKIRFEAVAPVSSKMKLFVNLVLPINDEGINENPPKEILDALTGITVYQMQQKANSDVKNGNYEQAIDRLGYISTQLLRLGKPSLAKKALKEAEILKKTKKYSMDCDKQLKYGTRALLAPEVEKRLS